MKLLIFTLALFTIITFPSFVFAEQVCVTQYGGGTVCGVKTPEYVVPKPTGIADFNLPLIACGFLVLSGALYYKGKRSAL